MRIYADLHIHSHYSSATSSEMVIPEIVRYAKLKGLNLIGTGDALHPSWIRELKITLEPYGDGIYTPVLSGNREIFFMVQTEVGTVFDLNGEIKRVHHVILMPSIEVAEQLSDILSAYGDVNFNGRPVFAMKPAELVEIVMEVDRRNFIFPAHAWTPWWSIFGSFSGVDRIEDCYEDQVKHVHAIETGLSSDPAMNWRLSMLDKYALVSFSDAHSPWPYRLGREACVFELNRLSYDEIISAIRSRDPRKFLMTIEVDPAYGKYHWSGHRACGIGPLSPREAAKLNYICPICGRKLTKGVEDRVEELADRHPGFKPLNAIPYVKLISLQELIAISMGLDHHNHKNLISDPVWSIYLKLIGRFGSEYEVLMNAPLTEIANTSSKRLALVIRKLRSNSLRILPGYDGVYGKIIFDFDEKLY